MYEEDEDRSAVIDGAETAVVCTLLLFCCIVFSYRGESSAPPTTKRALHFEQCE
jgi:hypothetical protein